MTVDTSTPDMDVGAWFRAVRVGDAWVIRFTAEQYKEKLIRAELRRMFERHD